VGEGDGEAGGAEEAEEGAFSVREPAATLISGEIINAPIAKEAIKRNVQNATPRRKLPPLGPAVLDLIADLRTLMGFPYAMSPLRRVHRKSVYQCPPLLSRDGARLFPLLHC
jgi:hypothetical protein